MSTTTLRIIELVKSLPVEEQRVIYVALASHQTSLGQPKRRQLERLADGSYFHPDGIPNEDPIFDILKKIEEERHHTPGRPPPTFD